MSVNDCIRKRAVENEAFLANLQKSTFFFRRKTENLSVLSVKISSLQVPYNIIQSVLGKKKNTILNLILHICLKLQVNEIYIFSGSLTVANNKVDRHFSDLIFANRISDTLCHISQIYIFRDNYVFCLTDKKCVVICYSHYCH